MTPPKLLDQVREAARLRHLSLRAEQAYVGWIRRYVLFHGKRHPREMGVDEIRDFLSDLAVRRWVSASTLRQAFSALLFTRSPPICWRTATISVPCRSYSGTRTCARP